MGEYSLIDIYLSAIHYFVEGSKWSFLTKFGVKLQGVTKEQKMALLRVLKNLSSKRKSTFFPKCAYLKLKKYYSFLNILSDSGSQQMTLTTFIYLALYGIFKFHIICKSQKGSMCNVLFFNGQ